MTDQTIPADKVQEVIDMLSEDDAAIRSRLEALLPPLPTLADMTLEKRLECQWMQADSEAWGRVIIVDPDRTDRTAALIDRQGMAYGAHTSVTPLPNLPRMEWPGEQKPSLDLPDGWRLADHPKCGRGIATGTTPNNYGNVCFLCPDDEHSLSYNLHYCPPAELTFLDPNQ